MLGVFIHMLEGIVVFLVALVAYRIYKLYQEQQAEFALDHASDSVVNHLMNAKACSNHEYEIKMAALKEAQVFSGTQLLPLKKTYQDLNASNCEWVKEVAAIYLVGAIEHIANSHQCDSKSRQELMSLILKSNLDIPLHQTSMYINEALYNTTNKSNASIVTIATNAASNWMKNGKVPQHMQLDEHISRSGIVA